MKTFMKTQLRADVQKMIKKGFGSYWTWIGWCKICRKFRLHTEPANMSYSSPTCSKGHYSSGQLDVEELSAKLNRKEKV